MQIDPTMCMKTKDTMTKCPAKCRTFATTIPQKADIYGN
jgi:hypothetical protein